MLRRHELTDAQWEAVRPFLSGKAGDPGRTAADSRRFVDAVLFVLKTGIPWADRPDRSPTRRTASSRARTRASSTSRIIVGEPGIAA